MPKLVRTNALRVIVIALYGLTVMLVGAVRHDAVTMSVGATAVDAAYVLPGDVIALLCQHAAGDEDQPGNGAPAGHVCCDACLIAHAPGLGVAATDDIAHPTASRIAPDAPPTHRLIAIWRMEPASRGPPIG